MTELLAGFVIGCCFSTLYMFRWIDQLRAELLKSYLEHKQTALALRSCIAEYKQLSKGLYSILKGETRLD